MHYRCGQTAAKKGDIVAFNSAHRAKKRNPDFTVAGLNENREVYVLSDINIMLYTKQNFLLCFVSAYSTI